MCLATAVYIICKSVPPWRLLRASLPPMAAPPCSICNFTWSLHCTAPCSSDPSSVRTVSAGELEQQLARLLQEQREVMLGTPVVAAGKFDADVYHKPRSRTLPFLTGALCTALVVFLTWCRPPSPQPST